MGARLPPDIQLQAGVTSDDRVNRKPFVGYTGVNMCMSVSMVTFSRQM